ncbi:hypothetical protein CABS01_16698 [Colletotrichum abscissum]|uniref:uncharacterized protein n=1 Tax=Colletotrichum abscissum TaxID=1671311 RepID=UPI0027D709DB|nr:uncharacterized protein CABS01_16698 [Colletotrichum abscissum]KAK1515470.1 hypothetical protein CABS01_16698 [Colletotrichum abscissum]
MIPYSKPFQPPNSLQYVDNVLKTGKLAQGPYTQRCEEWLEDMMQAGKAFLVTSGTTALEMAAMVIDIQAGDEVIFPSYTFVSTVNAFVSRGATPVFVDIERDTMNMDANLVEAAISERTRAIVPVHYAGISCDMDALMDTASRHNLLVVEDAAQSLTSKYRGVYSGTIGHIGCISFHETKNVTSGGQGGAVLINRDDLVERAEVVYDNGTNRVKFFREKLPMYEWQDIGSNYDFGVIISCVVSFLVFGWSLLPLLLGSYEYIIKSTWHLDASALLIIVLCPVGRLRKVANKQLSVLLSSTISRSCFLLASDNHASGGSIGT